LLLRQNEVSNAPYVADLTSGGERNIQH